MRVPASATMSFAVGGVVLLTLLPISCTVKEPEESTYFQRAIAPILSTACVRTNTGAGCHVADAKGNAFGNLDLSSFDGVDRRRDLLADYGPYGQPTLLLKSILPFQARLQAYDGAVVTVVTDIKHAGGPILDPAASAYRTLRKWIENGAAINNSGRPPARPPTGECSTDVPSAPGFDPAVDPADADFAAFRDRVQPVLSASCAATSCHGSAANDLRLACGDAPERARWNYFVAVEYLAQSAEQSELLRRPLAPSQGGSFHEGGIVFASTADEGYRAMLEWATAHGPLKLGALTPEFEFFAHRVQPLLVAKGCMLLHCHSASSFHDYRLRGGSGGSFSLSTTRRNYDLTLAQLALESDDASASRLVKKNLYRPEVFEGGTGIVHRGGPLLEDFSDTLAGGAACDAKTYEYDTGPLEQTPAYCMIREWLRRERATRALAPLSGIVYVKRAIPAAPDRMQDFDVYAASADLRIVTARIVNGEVVLGADSSVTAACGLDPSKADIRRPSVSWDGKLVAFAARQSATEPLAVYRMNADGSQCAKDAAIDAGPASQNGLLVHNFDPAFSPPDARGAVRIVFASTRGNRATDSYDYSGPQRTPADPTKPNANLYVLEPDPAAGGATRIRQLTYLLDMERAPSFMSDGRVIFTTEKRAPGNYQLALRRINLDGGDYHPLYGQRASIGYREVTQVVHLADKNFAAIFAEPGVPHHGGALGVFNRSIGIDFTSTAAGDYLLDPSVADPSAPSAPEMAFFLRSLRFPDTTASGRIGQRTTGLYTSPSPLPNGKILVSFGAASDAQSFGGDYDLYVLDPSNGAKTKVLGDAGSAEIEAVAIYARPVRAIYRSAPSEPNAYTMLEGHAEADVTIHDVRALVSLMFQNTPTGRVIEQDLSSFDIYESLPPTPEVTSFAAGGAFVASDEFGQVYVRRRKIGTVPVASDGSAHYQMPGGVPFVIVLPDTRQSGGMKLPRVQREEMMFTPGEYVHETLPRDLFDGFCGNCHGSISGRPLDVAMKPDVLSRASDTMARGSTPTFLLAPPSQRGPIVGPSR